MTIEEILSLLHSTETSRIERTESTTKMDKFQEAICAFSNDMSNSRQNGYLIIGAKDNGELSGLKVDDADSRHSKRWQHLANSYDDLRTL